MARGGGYRPALRLGLAACTAFTIVATSAMAQTTSNVVVDPVDRTAQEATPTVSETLMGVVDRVERLSGRVDPIKEDYVICRSTAVREGAGEASEPQLIACGIALETQRIAFFEDTKAALKQSSIDAAVQEELIEKDLMHTTAELQAAQEASDIPDRHWSELERRKRHPQAMADGFRKKIAFLERDMATFRQLSFALNQAALDQDLYIQQALHQKMRVFSVCCSDPLPYPLPDPRYPEYMPIRVSLY